MKIKKLGFVLLIVSMMSTSLIAQGQSDSLVSDKVAYLYFYRIKQFMGSGNGIGIKINENEIQRLKNGTRLIVEYSQLNQPIVITYYNKINFMTAFGKLEIEPKGGKIYYIKVNWGNDNEIGNQVQIAELSQNTSLIFGSPQFNIHFIQKDEENGKRDFYNNDLFKDKMNIKRIRIDK